MIPYLRSLGIKADDIVVCSTDNSPNIALYFLQLQGWTTGQYRKIDIPTFVEKGAKYLIVIDSSFYQDPKFINSKHRLLGEHKGVGVFSIEK